ncbi:MAG TPA: hypothetical protein VIJ04_12510 [Xanthobacteraceae bacterium]
MLKIAQIVAAVAVIALLLSLAGVAYLSSPPPGNPSQQQSAAEAKSGKQPEEKRSLRGFIGFLFPDSIAFFTFWLMLATVILGIVAVVQIGYLSRAEFITAATAKAAKDQAKAAADANIAATKALQQSQRPWVIADSIVFARPISYTADRYDIQLNLMLKNTGPSIATDVFTVMRLEENLTTTLETNWNKTDEDLRDRKENVIKQSKWPLGIVLAPGQFTPQPFGFGGPADKPGSPPAVKIRGRAYYFLGLIEYKDQFGLTHKTRFAFNPDPWGGGSLVVSGGMQEAD